MYRIAYGVKPIDALLFYGPFIFAVVLFPFLTVGVMITEIVRVARLSRRDERPRQVREEGRES